MVPVAASVLVACTTGAPGPPPDVGTSPSGSPRAPVLDLQALPEIHGAVDRILRATVSTGHAVVLARAPEGRWGRVSSLDDLARDTPALSPDGRRAAFVTVGRGGLEVDVVDLDTRAVSVRVPADDTDLATCTPQLVDWWGEELAVLDGCARLFVLDADGGPLRRIWAPDVPDTSTAGESGVEVSPDGRLFALTYLDPRLAEDAGEYTTVVVDRRGEVVRRQDESFLVPDSWDAESGAVSVVSLAEGADVRSLTLPVAPGEPRPRHDHATGQGAPVGQDGEDLLVVRGPVDPSDPRSALDIARADGPGAPLGTSWLVVRGLLDVTAVESRPGQRGV